MKSFTHRNNLVQRFTYTYDFININDNIHKPIWLVTEEFMKMKPSFYLVKICYGYGETELEEVENRPKYIQCLINI